MKALFHFILFAGLLVIVTGSRPLAAQNLIEANPANFSDHRSAFINPAIIMNQGKQVHAGIRIFQMGFLDNNATAFKHSYVGYSQAYSMWPKTGFGVTAQYLSTPVYTQGNYSLLAGRKITDILSIGARLNVFSKGYSLENADLIDPRDPVFSKGLTKYVFSGGLGMFIGPVSNLAVGIAVDHLNRPNVSLAGTPLRQPITFDFGISYTFSSIGPAVYVNYQDNRTATTFGFDWQYHFLGHVGLYYGARSLILDAGINVLDHRMTIGYRMDFPLMDLNDYSVGTHLLGLAYRFSDPIDADFEIMSSVDFLNVSETFLTVEADRGIELKDLNALEEYSLDIFDRESLERLKDSANVVEVRDLNNRQSAQLDQASYKYYKKTLVDMIEKKIAQTGGRAFKVEIMSPPRTGNRALALLNFVVDTLGMPAENVHIVFTQDYSKPQKTNGSSIIEAIKTQKQDANTKMKRVKVEIQGSSKLSEDQTVFKVRRLRSTKPVHSWRVVIERNDRIIKKIVGVKEPNEVPWDWKDEEDLLVQPGEYFYYFQWKDKMLGTWTPSSPRKKVILVEKDSRRERIFLTKDGRPFDEDPNTIPEKVEFLLKETKKPDVSNK
ncbi:type IX secretion system membrane protein PorP/SprF [candidate division KSB1 bacterium]|nr:type IX secretion system membrane protein PorP/SprF [candidate division KSB1 bacterium]